MKCRHYPFHFASLKITNCEFRTKYILTWKYVSVNFSTAMLLGSAPRRVLQSFGSGSTAGLGGVGHVATPMGVSAAQTDDSQARRSLLCSLNDPGRIRSESFVLSSSLEHLSHCTAASSSPTAVLLRETDLGETRRGTESLRKSVY